MTASATRARLRRVLRRLERHFGPRAWKPAGPAVGELIGTILSQNTTGANAAAGLRRLWRRFRSFSAMADAPESEIEKCIRVCGLSRIKAPRIRRILRRIRDDRPGHGVSLEFLKTWPTEKAYRYLLGFDGVGPKTAACVLLFAFGREVFPVDTHVHRIATRLGVLDRRASPEEAQEILTPLIAPKDRYAMHVLLVAHGRAICKARNPACGRCPLLRLCPHGQRLVRPGGTA